MRFKKVVSLICCGVLSLSLTACSFDADMLKKSKEKTEEATEENEETEETDEESGYKVSLLDKLNKKKDDNKKSDSDKSESEKAQMIRESITSEEQRAALEEFINSSDEDFEILENVLLDGQFYMDAFSAESGLDPIVEDGHVVFEVGGEKYTFMELRDFSIEMLDEAGCLEGKAGNYKIVVDGLEESEDEPEEIEIDSMEEAIAAGLEGSLDTLLAGDMLVFTETIINLTDEDMKDIAEMVESEDGLLDTLADQMPAGVGLSIEGGELCYEVMGQKVEFSVVRDALVIALDEKGLLKGKAGDYTIITDSALTDGKETEKDVEKSSSTDSVSVSSTREFDGVVTETPEFKTETVFKNEYIKIDVTGAETMYGNMEVSFDVENLTDEKLLLTSNNIIINGINIDDHALLYGSLEASETTEIDLSISRNLGVDTGIEKIANMDVIFDVSDSQYKDLCEGKMTLEATNTKGYKQEVGTYPSVYEDEYVDIQLREITTDTEFNYTTMCFLVVNKTDKESIYLDFDLTHVNGSGVFGRFTAELLPGTEYGMYNVIYSRDVNGVSDIVKNEEVESFGFEAVVEDADYNTLASGEASIEIE